MDRDEILSARLRSCADSLPELLSATFAEMKPADRILGSFLRMHKNFGGSDRRLLTESFFSILRWWGFVSKIFPETAERIRNPQVPDGEDIKPETFNFYRIILFSLAMDGITRGETADVLCEKAAFPAEKLPETGKIKDFAARAGAIIEKFKRIHPACALANMDLIPDWTGSEISSGERLDELIKWFQKRPPMWLRAQTEDIPHLLKELELSGLEVSVSDKIPNALRIATPKVNLYSLESFKKGHFEVQDIASQVIGLVCAPVPGQRWWDACAGAGGKSLELSSLMKNKGSVVSTDIREYKLEDLKIRARRAGFSNIRCSSWDGKGIRTKNHETFDGVLVDAPCSCSGTWRRNPDARWTSSCGEIAELAALQGKLLSNASKALKKDGILVYATCSIFFRENEHVMNDFLANNKDFALSPFLNPLTGEECDGTIRVRPWDADCDAMFAAKFRRIKAS